MPANVIVRSLLGDRHTQSVDTGRAHVGSEDSHHRGMTRFRVTASRREARAPAAPLE